MMKMKNLQKNWNKVRFGLILSALVLVVSCSEDEAIETVYAAPTIEIISPADLSNLEALVASPISFTIKVDAEAGLSSVSLNGNNIKTYSQGELTDTFDHEFVPGENGTIALDFAVEDAQGTSSTNVSLNLNAVGDFGFLIADFGGDPGSSTTLSTIDPDHWDGTRAITTFAVNGNLTSTATYENAGSQFTIITGATNPDADAPLVYSGKTMKVVKNPAEWGTAGWSHIMFDFGTTMDQAIVEALPQVNAERTGLTAGTKFVEIDVFYQDSDAVPFSSMVGDDVAIGDNPAFGSDKTKGYSFFLMLTKHEEHRLNPDGGGMYIGYEEYITEANTWITLRFDELYLESVENFFEAGTESTTTSEVIDGVKIVAGGGYGDGQSENAIYFRNLRIIDAN